MIKYGKLDRLRYETRPTGKMRKLRWRAKLALGLMWRTAIRTAVWYGGVNWVGSNSRQVRSGLVCVGRRNATAGRTPTHNAVVAPTQFTPPRQTRHDCRACLSTAAVTQARPGRQQRLAARPTHCRTGGMKLPCRKPAQFSYFHRTPTCDTYETNRHRAIAVA